jgi:CRP/FNR family transcriptional regulator, cyclic AMP receptor protein
MSALRARSATKSCYLLEVDCELAQSIRPAARERAAAELVAPVLRISPGHWDSERSDIARGGIGLLVLDGLLIRRVGIDRVFGAELLGAGDLLQPWHGEDTLPTLIQTTGWRALEPTLAAVLDRRVAALLAPYPEVVGELVGRALARSRHLAVNMAIVHQPRVDVRLQMLFWQLADRWGRVRPDGVVLPLRLTHVVLADLVAARRPTVTSALSELTQRGLIVPMRKGWLLSGQPPAELSALAPASSRLSADGR